ncbi:mad16 [Candidatus Magnetomoraceae bacterium gMMP-15]
MNLDTSTLQGTLLQSGVSSSSTSALSTSGSGNLGICPIDSSSAFGYGAGLVASVGIIGTVLISGAVLAGVGLLSYAVTKAAIEP